MDMTKGDKFIATSKVTGKPTKSGAVFTFVRKAVEKAAENGGYVYDDNNKHVMVEWVEAEIPDKRLPNDHPYQLFTSIFDFERV